jgi:tRNA A-37 threonylcarbamoyl transferase component Bud32
VPDLEQILRNLPQIGMLVKDRGYRQVWRFEHEGKAYYLKFYPSGNYRDRFRRFFRGSPAMWEFKRLQWLQKTAIPAPRAHSVLMGFRINDRIGDAVISEAIEPSIQLDQLLIEAELRGEPVSNHRWLMQQVLSIVRQLGSAGLGHEDLHLGNFLLHDNQLFLLDAYAVRAGGLRMRDLLMLGHSARRFATTADMIRGWTEVGLPGSPPPTNSVSQMLWKRFAQSITDSNRYFGSLKDPGSVAATPLSPPDSASENGDAGVAAVVATDQPPTSTRAAVERRGWSGFYCKRTKYSHRWSEISRLEISDDDWAREWPLLLEKIEKGQLPAIKRSRSGEVLTAQVTLGGQPRNVIVKRPRRRYWYRYLNEIGRGHRARRAWKKAWALIARGLPTAWPVLLMEKRVAGYVVDAVLISEQVPGDTLAHCDLGSLPEPQRDQLFRRAGHVLRAIEKFGFSHFDAKASNWIVFNDEKTGPTPVMIDVDGIRRRNWVALGIHRLLKSMQENPNYTPADSFSLCKGYAPFAPLGVITPEEEPAPVGK